MNGIIPSSKPTNVQVIAVLGACIMSCGGMFAFVWCAMFKVYMDAPMLIALSSITSGIAGALTTVLVGRSIPQLNQLEEPIQTTIKQPPDKPIPVAPVETKPEVTI